MAFMYIPPRQNPWVNMIPQLASNILLGSIADKRIGERQEEESERRLRERGIAFDAEMSAEGRPQLPIELGGSVPGQTLPEGIVRNPYTGGAFGPKKPPSFEDVVIGKGTPNERTITLMKHGGDFSIVPLKKQDKQNQIKTLEGLAVSELIKGNEDKANEILSKMRQIRRASIKTSGKKYPEGYSQDVSAAFEALDKGANPRAVFSRLRKKYSKHAKELKSIIVDAAPMPQELREKLKEKAANINAGLDDKNKAYRELAAEYPEYDLRLRRILLTPASDETIAALADLLSR